MPENEEALASHPLRVPAVPRCAWCSSFAPSLQHKLSQGSHKALTPEGTQPAAEALTKLSQSSHTTRLSQSSHKALTKLSHLKVRVAHRLQLGRLVAAGVKRKQQSPTRSSARDPLQPLPVSQPQVLELSQRASASLSVTVILLKLEHSISFARLHLSKHKLSVYRLCK